MDLIVASSRGKGLKTHLINRLPGLKVPFKVTFRGGAGYWRMASMAEEEIGKASHSPHITHVYFFGGMCEVTEVLSDDCDWQECIFRGTVEGATANALAAIMDAETRVRKVGALPVFCTIVPLSLKLWNEHRLRKGCTTHLKYTSLYPKMQRNLELTIQRINTHIHRINSQNNMLTPMIAEELFKSPQANRRSKLRTSQFYDGCHVNPFVKLYWAEEILRASIKNRHGLYIPQV